METYIHGAFRTLVRLYSAVYVLCMCFFAVDFSLYKDLMLFNCKLTLCLNYTSLMYNAG